MIIDIGQEQNYVPNRDASIARPQCCRRHELTPRAVACQGDACGIDPEDHRVGSDFPQHRLHVKPGCREWMLWCSPVVNRDDGTARCAGQRPTESIVGLEVTEHPSASVRVDDRGEHRLRIWVVKTNRDRDMPPDRQVDDTGNWLYGTEGSSGRSHQPGAGLFDRTLSARSSHGHLSKQVLRLWVEFRHRRHRSIVSPAWIGSAAAHHAPGAASHRGC